MSANRHRELALTEAYDWSAFCDQLCQTILFQMHALSDVTPYTLKVLVGLGQMGLVANSALPNGDAYGMSEVSRNHGKSGLLSLHNHKSLNKLSRYLV